MTVCCRSNDMLWGAYGANAVHMSVLQEYVATMVGVEMGEYRQVSDSFHIYLFGKNPTWDKVKDLTIDPYTFRHLKNPYDRIEHKYTPLITDPEVFNWELKRFFTIHPSDFDSYDGWGNPAFKDIAVPMMRAYALHKEKKYSVYKALNDIKPVDWQTACFDWIRKRDKAYNKADKEDS
jgi:hypothetical protein